MKKLQILGMGCTKCNRLQEMTEQAAKELGIDYALEKVTNFEEIAKYGIMMTPALVVDSVLKVYGRVPSLDELKQMIG